MSKELEFVNPYHFITTNDKCDRGKEKGGKEKLTGYIDFKIETKTPLFIPNMNKEKKEKVNNENKEIEHSYLEFFTYAKEDSRDDYKNIEPIIPGSSIRGMIRNIYETLTDSCLSVIDEDSILYKRTNDHYSHGLLKRNKDGKISLYEAKDAIIQSKTLAGKYKEGQKVTFDVFSKKGRKKVKNLSEYDSSQKDKKVGYILNGEVGPLMGKKTKKYSCIFYLESEENLKSLKDDIKSEGLLDRFKYILKSYSDEKINKNLKDNKRPHKGYKEYSEEFEKFLKGKGEEYFPVYYSKIEFYNGKRTNNDNNPIYYLSPACVTKEVYQNTISNLLQENGDYNPCKDDKNLCKACRLFGMVGENEDKNVQAHSKSSLIRIEDGVLASHNEKLEDLYLGEKTLRELSSPKLSSTEFYLQKPIGADFWTYDYYVKNGKIYEDFPKISGRKYYWHHPKVNFPDCEKTERNRTVNPIKEGIIFKSRLYFENISEKQLKQLIWICNISSDGNLGYKLGMGKPIGLGSVKLTIDNVKIRSFIKDNKLGYYLEDYQSNYKYNYSDLGFDERIKDSFEIICNFNSLKEISICYPVSKGQSPDNVEKGYEWFSYNRFKKGKGNGKMVNRGEMELDQYLEPLSNKVQKLMQNKKGYEKINKGKGIKKKVKNINIDSGLKHIDFDKFDKIEKGSTVSGIVERKDEKFIVVKIKDSSYKVDLRNNKRIRLNKRDKIKFKIKSKFINFDLREEILEAGKIEVIK